MKENIHEYKCPGCAGPLVFEIGSQMMHCSYCGADYPVGLFSGTGENPYRAPGENRKIGNGNTDESPREPDFPEQTEQEREEKSMRVYVCTSCGSEIIADATIAASKCPYCDSPVILTDRITGKLRPNSIIPFTIDKESAIETYLRHIRRKPLLPGYFRDKKHIQDICGLYVPFWLYSTSAGGQASYEATTVSHWSDSRYDYTETSYYDVGRAGSALFSHVPADGSSKMPDDMMESIEPFRHNEAVDFNTAYLSGFVSDRYDADSGNSFKKPENRIRNSFSKLLRDTVKGYSSVRIISEDICLPDVSVEYSMYPVWILNTVWKGKKYTFAMNGQTGKFAGDLPSDRKKIWLFISLAAVPLAVAVWYLTKWFITETCGTPFYSQSSPVLHGAVSLLGGMLLAFIPLHFLKKSMKNVTEAKKADSYLEEDSFSLQAKEDRYLYSHTTRTERQNSQKKK